MTVEVQATMGADVSDGFRTRLLPFSQTQRGAVDIALRSSPHFLLARTARVNVLFRTWEGKESHKQKTFRERLQRDSAIRSGHLHPLPHKRWSPPSLPEVDVDVFFHFCCFPFCFFFFFVCFLPFFGHWCLCCFSFSFFLFFVAGALVFSLSFLFRFYLWVRSGEGGGEREGGEVGAKGGRPKISHFFSLSRRKCRSFFSSRELWPRFKASGPTGETVNERHDEHIAKFC